MVRLECIKSVATLNGNTFIKGEIYDINSEDEQVLFLTDEHKREFFFIKPHLKLDYFLYNKVEEFFSPNPINKRFVIIEKIGRQFNFKKHESRNFS